MVVITSLDLNQLDNESENEYIKRICSIKDTIGMTWKQVADHLNNSLSYDYCESWYRKNYKAGNFDIDVGSVTVSSDDYYETADSVIYDDKLRQLMLKKVEVSDLVTQNNAYIRRLSREQTIKDIARDYAATMNKDKILDGPFFQTVEQINDAEGILLLSDWHYGMVCDNAWNKFNPEICKERVNKLLKKVIDIVKKNRLDKVHVLDLADLIAGRIHTQIRIESRFDVITQTMQVAEILAEFLNDLSHYCGVSFYSCLDNHSRLEPNKKESLDLESLARIIPWYLKDRLKGNDFIEICNNKFSEDIITCTVAGHNVIGAHGDNDNPVNGIDKLTLMTHQHYDLFCTAHFHHMTMNEKNHCLIVGNSSLMGTDSYAEKLRLSSDPSQTFIVATPENVCECIYRIVLK